MASTHLQREIDRLKHELLALSGEVENMIEDAYRALIQVDVNKALEVVRSDELIDQHEVQIEEECLKIMALHQPVARDLRIVVALLKMNNDLERMADLAQNIAKYVIKISQLASITIPPKFDLIFTATRKMVRDSLDALVNGDVELAKRVRADDDAVDELNVQIIDEVTDAIHRNPEQIRALVLLISVSRSIERIADNATNIAEDVIYMLSGEIVRHLHRGQPSRAARAAETP